MGTNQFFIIEGKLRIFKKRNSIPPDLQTAWASECTLMLKKLIILTIIFVLLGYSSVFAEKLDEHRNGIWSISGTADENRWIIIHNLQEGNETGIFHIEVIARKTNDPKWKIKHVVKHMAITRVALLKSIKKPLEKGFVYPETFDDALRKWQKEDKGKGGNVCDSTIEKCIKK